MSSLDVALVAQAAVRGDGQGRAVLELASALADRGHHVTLYAHRIDDELARRVRSSRVRRVPGPQILDDLYMLIAATRAVRRGSHDVACVVGPTALPHTPFALSAHFSHRGWRRTWTRRSRPRLRDRAHALVAERLETVCARRAQRILAVSESLGRDLAPNTPGKVAVVPNGVDTDELGRDPTREDARERHGIPPEAWVVGFLGGWATRRKGLEPLIDAVAGGRDDERLLVAGEGPRAVLDERIRTVGVADRVVLAGFRPAPEVLACCDVVAVPSSYEPFSLVAFEAAVRAIPVILSASAGAAEHLEGAAVIVDDPTDPAALRAALDDLRNDPAAARRMGELGRAAASRMRWPFVLERAVGEIEVLAQRPEACASGGPR